MQTAWGLLRRTVSSRFLHVLRGHTVDITAEFCDGIQDAIHKILAQWTDQGGLTPGQQRIAKSIEGCNQQRRARPGNQASAQNGNATQGHSRQCTCSPCGMQCEVNLQAPHQILLAKSFKDAWMYADHVVPQLKHCWLRNVNKHTLNAGQGAPGVGHWLYTLPTAPFTKVAN